MQDESPERGAAPERLAWSPLIGPDGATANFKTRHLVQVSPQRLEVRATLTDRIFSAVFIGLGVLALALSPITYLSDDTRLVGSLMCLLFAAAFGGVGLWLWRRGNQRLVFDRDRGEFWSTSSSHPAERDEAESLSEVAGLQLLSKRVSDSDGDWISHELNLVRRAGERTLVMEHAELAELRRAARRLAEFLAVELWDRASESRALLRSR